MSLDINQALIKNAKKSSIFSFIGLAVIFGLLLFSSVKLSGLNAEIGQQKDSIRQNFMVLDSIEDMTSQFKQKYMNLLMMSLNSFGWPSDSIKNIDINNPAIRRAIKANDQIREIVYRQNYDSGNSTIIEYYEKSKDDAKVEVALEEFGFDVHVKESRESMRTHPTNAVWFGDAVDQDDVKLVAYLLIRSGVRLKIIERVTSMPDNKIIIGARKRGNRPLNEPILEIEEITSAETFKVIERLNKNPVVNP